MGKWVILVAGALIIGIAAFFSKPPGLNQFDMADEVVTEKLLATPEYLFSPFATVMKVQLSDGRARLTEDGDIIWTFTSKGRFGGPSGEVELLGDVSQGLTGRTTVDFSINFKENPELTAMPLTQKMAQIAGTHMAYAQMTTGEVDSYRLDQDWSEFATINSQALMQYKTQGMFQEVSKSMDEAVANFDAAEASRSGGMASSPRSTRPTTDLSQYR